MGRTDNLLDTYEMPPLVAKDIPIHSVFAVMEAVAKRAREDYIAALVNIEIGYPDVTNRKRKARLAADHLTLIEVEDYLYILGLNDDDVERFKNDCGAEAEKRINAWNASAQAREIIAEHWIRVLEFEAAHPNWKDIPALKDEHKRLDKERRARIRELADEYNLEADNLSNFSTYAKKIARKRLASFHAS